MSHSVLQHSPRISILALPQSAPAALYGLFEVFASVGHTWEDLTGEPSDGRRLSPKIVSNKARSIHSPVGLTITPNGDLDDADVVIITEVAIPPEENLSIIWQAEIEWLKKRHEEGAILCSVCTGSVVLAEAGLLDGLEATTHWSAVEYINSKYPAVKLAPQKILVPAGPANQIITGGGASSWEDMALYLVARLSSRTEAIRMSKLFVLGDRSEGQLPFAGAAKPRQHEDGIVASIQEWIADNYHLGNPVAHMVKKSGLRERTFIRRFKTATGYSPIEYVQTLRIEEAKFLLETSKIPVEMVALEVGYEDTNFFRRLFKRKAGVTPARYRQRIITIAPE